MARPAIVKMTTRPIWLRVLSKAPLEEVLEAKAASEVVLDADPKPEHGELGGISQDEVCWHCTMKPSVPERPAAIREKVLEDTENLWIQVLSSRSCMAKR